MKVKYIYIVVRFSHRFIEQKMERHKKEKAAQKAGERKKFKKIEKRTKAELIEQLKALSPCSPESFGFFDSVKKAEAAIQAYPQMSEWNYYTLACVEAVPFGYLEAYSLNDPESWWKYTGKRYVKCKKPEWAIGTVHWH